MPGVNRFTLHIAGLSLDIQTEQNLVCGAAFKPFLEGEEGRTHYTARFRKVEVLPELPKQVIREGNCYRIHRDEDGGCVRSFFDERVSSEPYAAAIDRDGWINVDYLDWGSVYVSEMSNSFSHLDFERILIRENRICFHAACIRTEMGGLLFSGPSGIGKSTQAELWRRFRGARLINGDRPILSKETDGWRAWGSPYAGSSKCYVNESCPVTAVIMLKQSPVCSLRRLSTGEAFRKVYSGVTVHSWDPYFMERVCDLVIEISAQIPVFEFSCTKEADAVDFLEKRLQEELRL